MADPAASLLHRRHDRPDARAEAIYSACLTYRYALTIRWDTAGPGLLMIMLNPSTATEVQNDPTITRCERRARALRFGSLRICNLFGLRATDPRDLRRHADPVGADNDAVLLGLPEAGAILCGWGLHGHHLGRGVTVEGLLRATDRPLLHLGLTKAGAPRHPLYIGYQQALQNWV